MASLLPAWIIQYTTRRPTITDPLTRYDREEKVVTGIDESAAERNLRQIFPNVVDVESISLHSSTGLA